MNERFNYVERPMTILDRKTKTLHNKVVKLMKVQWQHREGSKWTWGPDKEIREHYPKFLAAVDFKDEV